MKELIEALQIFLKYGNSIYPTHCEQEKMVILDIDPDNVSDEDKRRLKELGFWINDNDIELKYFYSLKYGSN